MKPTLPAGPRSFLLVVLGALAACSVARSQPAAPAATASATTNPATTAPATGPATRPIATAKTPVGELLRQWWAQGTAAGNVGDIYDNRDRGHSELNRAPYPQLGKFEYTKQQLDTRRDWAAQQTIVRGIVFGNSSTSAPITMGGSNVRMYYTHPRGLAFLFTEYASNNLYIYPEHQDHDPGHNGTPGYGDVYPTNTPYLLTSQGSSGSDQPFMKALPYTLAAFRPEVKRKLAETGLLMPAIQMILRSTMKNVKAPEDYLTGIAHPTVFEGANVDDLKMVKLAHEITLETLPPLARIKVEEEDQFANGRDFFDLPGTTEQHADTPCVIARIWRAATGTRRIVVSAEASGDINKRPLKFHWSILRGDAKLIAIKPLNESASRAEITLSHHDRRPISPGAALESNRVDIGVFAHNGAYWSPPAFITFFGIDSEARRYDKDGRILEIGYGNGTTQCAVSDWVGMFDALAAEKPLPGIEWLRNQIPAAQLDEIAKVGQAYKSKVVIKDPKARELIDNKQGNLPGPIKSIIEGAITKLVEAPGFIDDRAPALKELFDKADAGRKKAIQAARARLVGLAIAREGADLKPELIPLPGDGPAPAAPSPFVQSQLARYHAELAAQLLFPALIRAEYKTNYVDPLIARPKNWRDVYHYGKDNRLAGWTRLGLEQTFEFTADGKLILEKDAQDKPARLADVRYEQPLPTGARPGPNWAPLKQVTVK